MHSTIADHDLRTLPPAEQAAVWRAMLEATRRPPEEDIADLDRELRAFEFVFSMSTAEMRERLANGSLRETHEVCRWLLRADLRDDLRAMRGAR